MHLKYALYGGLKSTASTLISVVKADILLMTTTRFRIRTETLCEINRTNENYGSNAKAKNIYICRRVLWGWGGQRMQKKWRLGKEQEKKNKNTVDEQNNVHQQICEKSLPASLFCQVRTHIFRCHATRTVALCVCVCLFVVTILRFYRFPPPKHRLIWHAHSAVHYCEIESWKKSENEKTKEKIENSRNELFSARHFFFLIKSIFVHVSLGIRSSCPFCCCVFLFCTRLHCIYWWHLSRYFNILIVWYIFFGYI